MVNTSKILTVSYGTFSCTLEGFDDSFETMKEIAEYFRDLAADDRFFGAEPPTPDAEMLARFAERKMAGRVEASENQGNMLLRAEKVEPIAEDQPASAQPAKESDVPEKSEEPEAVTPENTPAMSPEPKAPIEPVQAEPQEPAGADSVVAKLRRLRSVVSEAHDLTEGEDYTEDEHAQDFLTSTAAELNAALAADDTADLVEEAEQELIEDDNEDDIAATLSLVAGENGESVSVNDGQIIDIEDEIPDEAGTAELSDEDIEQLLQDAMDEDAVASAQPKIADAEVISDDSAQSSQSDHDEPANEEPEQGSEDRANQTLFGESDEFEDGDSDLPDAVAEEDAGRNQEPGKAETEADPEAEKQDDSAEASVESVEPIPQTRVVTPERPQRSTDVSRIFEKADSQLQKPDSSRRRSAIQHLRAAVASARADKNAGVDMKVGSDEAPYRDTLDNVVRGHPQTGQPSSDEDSDSSQSAPLKLVAEQRVDLTEDTSQPQDEAQEPVETSAGDFSNFARQMGATSLPDVLEAAAAYMSDVEGRPQFSRPMLMSKLKEVQETEFSREDGLRSFGQLLRTGKLQKLKGGRFSVTERTEFRAEARNAG